MRLHTKCEDSKLMTGGLPKKYSVEEYLAIEEAGGMKYEYIDGDSGTKANFYRSLPSVQVYLLIDQDRPFAQLFTRHEAGWLLREYEGLDKTIPLDSIGCHLEMSEVYLDIFEK